MMLRGHLLAIAVLAACTAGLAEAVHHLWKTPLRPAAPQMPAAGEPAMQLPEGLSAELNAPPSLALSEFLERPLFSPTRRPPVPEPQPVAEPVPEPRVVTFVQEEPEPVAMPETDWRELRLIGVFQAEKQRRALLTTPEDPEGTWLAEGEDLSGWRIVAIAANQVEVVSGEERHTLSLLVGE